MCARICKHTQKEESVMQIMHCSSNNNKKTALSLDMFQRAAQDNM